MSQEGPSPVPIGAVIADRYRVERVLGAGGMGCVVAARHIELGELVAIKFLLRDVVDSEIVVARFFREARAAAKIKSEHVVRVSDVGRLPDGAPYMVMEHLHGHDLSELLRSGGPMPIGQAVGYLLEACEALDEAHAGGIVHRDLKPSNLFLATLPDGRQSVKVLDFGIAKAMPDAGASSHEKSLTAATSVVGSPLYMSPEQVQSSKLVDARADIWSLGIILHELIAGRPPFDGETLGSVLVALSTAPAPPLRTLRPDVPEGLERAVLRCLEKSPTARFPDVRSLVGALAPFATFAGAPPKIFAEIHAHGALATSATSAAVATRTVSDVGPRRSPWLQLAAVTAAVGVAVSVTFVLATRNGAPGTIAASPPSGTTLAAAPSAASPLPPIASASASAPAPTPVPSSEPARTGRTATPRRSDAAPVTAPPVVAPPAAAPPPPAKPLDVTSETRK